MPSTVQERTEGSGHDETRSEDGRSEDGGRSDISARSDDVPISRDGVLEVLSNRRRRFALHYLKSHAAEEVSLHDLAEQVASWELGRPVADLDYRERKRVVNAMRQHHLPKMADNGLVDYDSRRGSVVLTPAAATTEFYVDVVPERGIPWGLYYLGLSAFSLLCLVPAWLNVPPFSMVTPLGVSVFLVTIVTISALGHVYDNYVRMRLGARSVPPEVEEG